MSARKPSSKDSNSAPVMAVRLWRDYLARYWLKLAVALIAMSAYAASASLIPAGVEWINSALAGNAPREGFSANAVVIWGPVIVVGLGLVNAASQFTQARMSASASFNTLRDLQRDVSAQVLAMDDAQLRRLGAGQVISRLTNDVTVLRETLTRTTTGVRDLLTLMGLCAVMIYYDWVLFAVVIAVYGVIGWPVAAIGKYIRKRSKSAQEQAGEISAFAGEMVSGARTIRAFNLQPVFKANGLALFDRRRDVLKSMAHIRAVNEPFVFLVGSIALAVVVAVVAVRVKAGALDVAQFISFIIALLLLSQPARGLSTLNAVAQEGFGALERLFAVIDTVPGIANKQGAHPINEAGGEIAFKKVSFAYDGERSALDGLDLIAEHGKTLALVGESGAGKSTVFTLLLRLYDIAAGHVTIDGVSISDADIVSLRDQIALVSQDAALFNDTIEANIGFGRLGATRDDIVAAAKAAAAHDFIEGFANGYETLVGEGGSSLSGGQRQRIAIARAFLKDAPILLLDEATSALDAETEASIQSALSQLSKGRTTIIIAHRLATVRHADLIAVMDKGRVVELGAHDDLMARAGVYKRLVELQFSD